MPTAYFSRTLMPTGSVNSEFTYLMATKQLHSTVNKNLSPREKKSERKFYMGHEKPGFRVKNRLIGNA